MNHKCMCHDTELSYHRLGEIHVADNFGRHIKNEVENQEMFLKTYNTELIS